jgi:hypothetical protein
MLLQISPSSQRNLTVQTSDKTFMIGKKTKFLNNNASGLLQVALGLLGETTENILPSRPPDPASKISLDTAD